MKIPTFVANEFVDQTMLNTAFNTVSGAIAGLGNIVLAPGLYRPDAIAFTVSGLVLNSTLNNPFGIITGTGDYVTAHGIVTNTDTQAYTTSFAAVVPGSGSVTAFLIGSSTTIQQNPYQVVGPPPGHPDYNPAFIPYTAYATNVETIALQASTTPADNSATFELARFTIAAGAVTLASPNTSFWNRTGAVTTYQSVVVGANTNVPVSGTSLVFTAVSGLTFSLPAVSGANENWYGFQSSTSGTVNVQVVGSDVIYGSVSNPASGITIMNVPQGAFVAVAAMNQAWQVVNSSQFGVTASGAAYIANAVSGFVKFSNATGTTPTLNFQGAASPLLVMAASGNVPVVIVASGVPSSGFNPGITGALYIN